MHLVLLNAISYILKYYLKYILIYYICRLLYYKESVKFLKPMPDIYLFIPYSGYLGWVPCRGAAPYGHWSRVGRDSRLPFPHCRWPGPVSIPPFPPFPLFPHSPIPHSPFPRSWAVHSRPRRGGSGAEPAPRSSQWDAAPPRVTQPPTNHSAPGLNFCHGGQVDTSRGRVRRAARGGGAR